MRGPAIWWLAIPAAVALVVSGVVAGRVGMRPAMADAGRGEGPATEDRNASSQDRRLAVLEREVARLRAEAAAARQGAQTEEREVQPESEEETNDTTTYEANEDPEEAERALAGARAAFLTGLEDRLDSEPEDARFSGEKEPALWRLLPQHLGTNVRVSSVSCGSTMCRARVEHPGTPHLPEGRLADFLHQRGPLESMEVQLDVRETEATTLYFLGGDAR